MRSSRLSTSRRTLPAVSQRVITRRARREEDDDDDTTGSAEREDTTDDARVDANIFARVTVRFDYRQPTDFYRSI